MLDGRSTLEAAIELDARAATSRSPSASGRGSGPSPAIAWLDAAATGAAARRRRRAPASAGRVAARGRRGYPSADAQDDDRSDACPSRRRSSSAVDTGDDAGWPAEDSLAELASLATTAGADVVGAEWQNRRHVDPNWYVGKGKAEELVAAKSETGFDVLIADDELSPGQQRALEELLKVKVIDRSRLILDIFALHAQTHEGRLQVELAQLEYQLPRLTRLWTHLSRTGGGIGTRGPGETQLETDRRIIRERIKKMKERVEQVRQQRATAARGRDRRLMPTVGIVGYTNSGKSTLLNALVGSEVALAEDKLFATLDPTSRQVKLGDGQTAIVTDTVGFIHKLPAPARRRVPGDARGGQPGRRADRGRRRRPIRTPPSTGRRSRRSSTSSGRATSRASSRSTRSTCSPGPGTTRACRRRSSAARCRSAR